MNTKQQTGLVEEILEKIEISPATYETAVKRYEAMTKWFDRPESELRNFDPLIYTQGSFRLGTVTRPILDGEHYDLDLVLRLSLSKGLLTQKELKELVGVEVKSYSKAQNFKKEPTNGKRCWTQEYTESGNTGFHMDILPAIPDGDEKLLMEYLEKSGTDRRFAMHAISITDKESASYENKCSDWPISNPKGFAEWFEEQANRSGLVKEARVEMMAKNADVEEVPLFRLKTPLQKAIQILKRHRDVKFRNDSENKPASIIISTLAARAYQGENDVTQALTRILSEMGNYVMPDFPRVQNPTKGDEDFTDRWDKSGHKEQCFWSWLDEAQRDFAHLGTMGKSGLVRALVEEKFKVNVSSQHLPKTSVAAAAAVGLAPKSIDSGLPPWGEKMND